MRMPQISERLIRSGITLLMVIILSSCANSKFRALSEGRDLYLPWWRNYIVKSEFQNEARVEKSEFDTLIRSIIDTIYLESSPPRKPDMITIKEQRYHFQKEYGCSTSMDIEAIARMMLSTANKELDRMQYCDIYVGAYLSPLILPRSDSVIVGNSLYFYSKTHGRNVRHVIEGDSLFVIRKRGYRQKK